MKKINFLGRSVSVLTLAIVAFAALGSAALVAYISNTVSGTATVSSPFTFEVSNNNIAYSSTADLGPIYGSDSVTLWTKITNKADNRIETEDGAQITIKNGDSGNVDCNEFTSIKAYETGSDAYLGELDSGLTCADNGATITITTAPINLDGGASQSIYFVITTAANIEPSNAYSYSGFVPYD